MDFWVSPHDELQPRDCHRSNCERRRSDGRPVMSSSIVNGHLIGTLERVTLTERIWNLGTVPRAFAIHILQNRPEGSFVVRSSGTIDQIRQPTTGGLPMMTPSPARDRLLHVRQGPRVEQYAIVELSDGRCRLLDSNSIFRSLSELIAHYCQQRSPNCLRLALPIEVNAAQTTDELEDIASRQAEFWVSILPSSSPFSSVSLTLPPKAVAARSKPPAAVRTQLSAPEQTGISAAMATVQSTNDPYSRSRGGGADENTKRRCRQGLGGHEGLPASVRSSGGKTSDYEDLWQSSTPDQPLVNTPFSSLDPAKYQLVKLPPPPPFPPADERTTGRPSTKPVEGQQRYQNPQPFAAVPTQSSSAAFEFDSSSLRRQVMLLSAPVLACKNCAQTSPLSQGPSPIYAEPWDAIVDRCVVQRSEDQHPKVTARLVGDRSRAQRLVDQSRLSAERRRSAGEDAGHFGGGGDDGFICDPVQISAEYRAPADAIPMASRSASHDTTSAETFQRFQVPEVVVNDWSKGETGRNLTMQDGNGSVSCRDSDQRGRHGLARGGRSRPAGIVSSQEITEMMNVLASFVEHVDEGRRTEEHTIDWPNPRSFSAASARNETWLDRKLEIDVELTSSRDVDRRSRLDYRSDYDNTSGDDDDYDVNKTGDEAAFQGCNDDEYDDEALLPPTAPRSRLMTGSSMRTEYSPPWDGGRWQELIAASSRQMAGRDNNNNSNSNTGGGSGFHSRDMSDFEDAAGSSDRMRLHGGWNKAPGSDVTRSSAMKTTTCEKYEASYCCSTNLMYCDSSLHRATSIADDAARGQCHTAVVDRRSRFNGEFGDPAVGGTARSDRSRIVDPEISRSENPTTTTSRRAQPNSTTDCVSAASGSRSSLARREPPPLPSTTTGTRHNAPVNRRPSAGVPPPPPPAVASSSTSTLLRNLMPAASSNPSSGFSTLSGAASGWNRMTSQKSPDVIPLIAVPRLISSRYRGHRFPAAQICDFIIQLTNQKSESRFGTLVQNFVHCTLSAKETNPRKVVSNIRQFMNGMKNYLNFHGEPELDKFIDSLRTEMKPSECLNLDAVVEMALIKCTIRPLKEHVYRLFEYDYTRNGNLQLLSDGLKTARSLTPAGLGIPPDFLTSVREVRNFLKAMEESYSPLTKLENLLDAMATICGSINAHYHEVVSSTTSGQVNTDELLSTIIAILGEHNMMSAEIEADYMWGLIPGSFLAGDARYQLTTFSSAVNQLKSLRKLAESRTTLCHGTMDPTLMSSGGGVDGFITVITVDECFDTVIRHALPVRPEMAAKDICSMLAHRLHITNPQDYGLYPLSSNLDKHLADDETILQLSKSSYDHRRLKLVYKRLEAHFVWPQNIVDSC